MSLEQFIMSVKINDGLNLLHCTNIFPVCICYIVQIYLRYANHTFLELKIGTDMRTVYQVIYASCFVREFHPKFVYLIYASEFFTKSK